MNFEKTSAKELEDRSFRLSDGTIITVWRADDLDVPYLERNVWFRKDRYDAADSGDGHRLLTFVEQLEEIRLTPS